MIRIQRRMVTPMLKKQMVILRTEMRLRKMQTRTPGQKIKETAIQFPGLQDQSKIIRRKYPQPKKERLLLVVVRVKKSKYAADVADEMLNGINPAKWICVEADDVRVAAYDDLVMLIMVSSQFEDTVTGKEMVSAFKKVCGGSLDVSKKR